MSYLGTSTLKATNIINGRPETVTGIDNQANNIKNMIEEDGDALGQYAYGIGINQFKNLTLSNTTALLAKRAIQQGIRRFIPAIGRLDISYTIDREKAAIIFLIIFVVKANSQEGSLVYPFYLN